ncbi:hypothetical protein D3C73_969730 [compost metagenome]
MLVGKALEHLEHALLGRHVEVDQQIAAEHEVVITVTAAQRRVEHVAHGQVHLCTHPLIQLMAFGERVEVALAKGQINAAERVATVDRLHALGHRIGADVDTVDAKRSRVHA